MTKLLIAVVAGGDSSEREISKNGAAHLYRILDRELYIPHIVDVSKNGWFVLAESGETIAKVNKSDFSFETPSGESLKFDYALINIHGTPGENGILQSYFELLSIPYSTCGVAASAITFDKIATKRCAVTSGVTMAKDVVVSSLEDVDEDAIVEKLSLPIFVKPNASGSSFGVTKVKSKEDIKAAVLEALKEDHRVLIEEAIVGTEISCGVMILDGEVTLFPATEIVSKSEFFDYKAKYEGGSEEITPANISQAVRDKLDVVLVKIYKDLDLRGVVRIDFIVKDETPYLIEINTVPGMSDQSIIPQQAKAMGITMTELYTKIIENTK